MPQRFSKTHDELAYLLVSRGMGSASGLSDDELRKTISGRLAAVNYYRLSAYWYQFRRPLAFQPTKRAKSFRPGTCWERIWAYYQFDRGLSLLLFEAISRIEVALREKVVAHLSALSPESPNAQNDLHLYRKGFKVAKQGKRGGVHRSHFIELMEKVNAAYRASGSMAAHHYIHEKHITDATFLPVWVFMEFATFGNLSVLLSTGLKMETVAAIAAELGFSSSEFFVSAISLLHRVRNECAHQGRVWNRHWVQKRANGAVAPILKAPERPAWKYQAPPDEPWVMAEDTEEDCLLQSPVCTATAILLCHLMLRAIAPDNTWRTRLFALFNACPIPGIAQEVGFATPHWQQHHLWL